MNLFTSISKDPPHDNEISAAAIRWWLKPVVFAGVVLILGSLLLRIVNTDFPAPSLYSRIRQAINTDTEILTVGNSLVIYGIQPSLLSRRAVNLAVQSGHYEVYELLLRRNLERCPNVKWVLIQLDNLCLLDDRVSRNRDHGPLYDLGVKRHDLLFSPWEYCRQFLMDNPIMYPIFFMPRLNPSCWWQSEEPPMYQEPGFLAYAFQMSDKGVSERNLAQDEYLLQSTRKEENWQALSRIIYFLRAQDIQIVFLRLPRLEAYSSIRSPEWIKTEEKLVQDVHRIEGERMILLDYRNVPWLATTHFYDTRHLNHLGATTLTRHLDEDLMKLVPNYTPNRTSAPYISDQVVE